MSDRFKFRIYSFLEKSFYFFSIGDGEDGYPQGLAGGVSEIQQYTGLSDSNDVPIYEGDILKISYGAIGDVIGQVLYEADHGGYIFQWERKGPNQHHINLNCDVAFESGIVGNIFENKELLS